MVIRRRCHVHTTCTVCTVHVVPYTHYTDNNYRRISDRWCTCLRPYICPKYYVSSLLTVHCKVIKNTCPHTMKYSVVQSSAQCSTQLVFSTVQSTVLSTVLSTVQSTVFSTVHSTTVAAVLLIPFPNCLSSSR